MYVINLLLRFEFISLPCSVCFEVKYNHYVSPFLLRILKLFWLLHVSRESNENEMMQKQSTRLNFILSESGNIMEQLSSLFLFANKRTPFIRWVLWVVWIMHSSQHMNIKQMLFFRNWNSLWWCCCFVLYWLLFTTALTKSTSYMYRKIFIRKSSGSNIVFSSIK